MMLTKPTLILFLLLALMTNLTAQSYEWNYRDSIQVILGGTVEYPVESGRVDILTDEYAIEVEFANKWKDAIGQALWYGLQTNRQPAIVLVKKTKADYKYVIQLGSALNYAKLDIKVWIWPDDFTDREPATYNAVPVNSGKYWMTKSSRKRHNPSCRYYKKYKGRYCENTEGTACMLCGG